MNEFLNFAVEMAREHWDVLAVMLGLPMLVVVGLGIAEVMNKLKGVITEIQAYIKHLSENRNAPA